MTHLGGWNLYTMGDPVTRAVTGFHIVPINDLRDHEQCSECWCKPRVENEDGLDFVTHNALDRREEFEEGRPTT